MSLEFGVFQGASARHRVGEVIVGTRRVVDRIAPSARRAALEAENRAWSRATAAGYFDCAPTGPYRAHLIPFEDCEIASRSRKIDVAMKTGCPPPR
jgi:hypothetical protein